MDRHVTRCRPRRASPADEEQAAADRYIITNLNQRLSPSPVTCPTFVWGAAQRGTAVRVNVVGTVRFLAALVRVVSGQLISNPRARAVA